LPSVKGPATEDDAGAEIQKVGLDNDVEVEKQKVLVHGYPFWPKGRV